MNPNDDELLIAAIAVEAGQRVEVGRELFLLESSKATVPVEADRAGYIRQIAVQVGQMVPVGDPLCVLTDTADEAFESNPSAGVARAEDAAAPSRVTAKERLRRNKTAGKTEPISSLNEASASQIPSGALPWVQQARAMLERLEQTGGDRARIDATAEIASTAVIRAKRLYVGPGARVGDRTTIEAESVYLGPGVRIGRGSHVTTGELIVDEGAVIADEVIVDLSGGGSRDSRLLVGAASLISSRALINTCREVLIESEAAVSPGAMLFTHSFWQSVLDGYSATFRPIRICERAWVGAGCQVLPGLVVGSGAIVMSNSTVVEDVPPGTLVGGVPARTIRASLRRSLAPGEQVQVLRRLLATFARRLEERACQVEEVGGVLRVTLPDGGHRAIAIVDPEAASPDVPGDSIFLTVGPRVPAGAGASIFDLGGGRFEGVEDRLTHELRNFLRRRGIRLRPFGWDSRFGRGL